MKRLFLLFSLVLLLLPGLALGATYYVDPSCTNAGDGTSQTCASYPGGVGPWKTIASVNAASFLYGDSVLLKAGGTWREEVDINLNKITAQNNRDFSGGTIGQWVADIDGTGTFAYNTTNIGGTDNKQALLTCGTATYAVARLPSANITLVANTTYTLTLSAYVPTGNTHKNIQLMVTGFTGATGNLTNATALTTLTGNTWTVLTGTVTLAASTSGSFGLQFYDGPANGDLLYIDNIYIQPTYSSSPITYSSYGTGANPIILGSDQIPLGETWTQHATNLWEIALASYGGTRTLYMGWRGTDINSNAPSTNGRLQQVPLTSFYTTEEITAENDRDFISGTIGHWGFDGDGTASFTYDTTNLGGAYNRQAKINCGTGASYAVARLTIPDYVTLTTSASFMFSVSIYVPSANTHKKVQILTDGFTAASGNLTDGTAYATLTGNTWTTVTGYINVAANAAGHIKIQFYDGPANGDLLYFQNASFKLIAGSDKTYAANATPATSVWVYSTVNPNTYAWEFASGTRQYCFSLTSAPHVTITGIDCQLPRWYGVTADVNSSYLTYQNSTMIATGLSAVHIQSPHSLIKSVGSYSSGDTAFYITYTTDDGTGENGAADTTVQYCTSKWSAYYEPMTGGTSLDAGCIGIQQNRVSALYNWCESNGPIAGLDYSNNNGQIATYKANNATIEYNMIIDSQRNALTLYSDSNTHHILTAYNIIKDWARTGETDNTHNSAIYAGVTGNTNSNWNHKIYNNTMVSTYDTRRVVGIYFDTPGGSDYQYGSQAENNIFSSGNNDAGTLALYFSQDHFGNSTGADASSFLIDYNDWYIPNNPSSYVVRYAGTSYTLTTWRALGKPVVASDAHSIITNPLFVSSTDFHLQAGSPGYGKGDPTVFSGTTNVTDYRGRAITDAAGNVLYPAGAFAIGAYQPIYSILHFGGKWLPVYVQ